MMEEKKWKFSRSPGVVHRDMRLAALGYNRILSEEFLASPSLDCAS
jgi:hypothetical protein